MRVCDLVCADCGSPDLVAVKAGAEAERCGECGGVKREAVADIGWCIDHWPFLQHLQAAHQ